MEYELNMVKSENSRLNGQVERHRSNIAEIRDQVSKSRSGNVVEQLTEEVQKAHDLEYLLRGKER